MNPKDVNTKEELETALEDHTLVTAAIENLIAVIEQAEMAKVEHENIKGWKISIEYVGIVKELQ